MKINHIIKKCEVVDNNYNVNKSNIELFFKFPKKNLRSPPYSTTTTQVVVKNLHQKKKKKDLSSRNRYEK
jgi:hypothetical protein